MSDKKQELKIMSIMTKFALKLRKANLAKEVEMAKLHAAEKRLRQKKVKK